MRLKSYQVVEREAEDVNLIWKVLHVLIFILIAVNSLVSAYVFADVFDYFDTRCPLYGKPFFHPHPMTLDPPDNVTKWFEDTTLQPELSNVSSVGPGKVQAIKSPDWFTMQQFATEAKSIPDWSLAEPVAGTKDVFVLEGQLWVLGEKKWLIYLRLGQIRYATKRICDLVFFEPLFSTAMAFGFAGMTITCGRGGRGHRFDIIKRSWIYVYPIIVSSLVMLLLSFVVWYLVYYGFQEFCQRFQVYIGQSECTELIDSFRVAHRVQRRPFYIYYVICLWSYGLQPILWFAQLVVGCARVTCIADFHFNRIKIIPKNPEFRDDQAYVEELYRKITKPDLYTFHVRPK